MVIWNPIPGYEGHYRISNKGEIKSIERIVIRADGRPRTIPEKIINPTINNRGYLKVRLHLYAEKKSFLIHRLVLKTFIGFNKDNPEVNHKNGIKTDNRLINLEWINRSENIKHAYRTGLRKPRRKYA